MKLTFLNHDHGEVVIDQGTVSIGSGAGNDVVIDAEGIADKHARLARENRSLYVRALEGADVYVNGRRIRDRTELRSGDVLGLHRVQARLIKSTEETPAAAPAPASETPDPTRVRPALANWYLRGVSGESFGRLIPLTGRMIVGRGRDCDVTLEAGEVSRQHAAVEVTGSEVRVEDMESANGTYVNGERIRKKTVIVRGDELAFDTLRFRLESGTGRQASPSAPPPKAPGRVQPERSRGNGTIWVVVVGAALVAAALAAWYMGWL